MRTNISKGHVPEVMLYKYSDEHFRYYNNYCCCGLPISAGQEPQEWVPASEVLRTNSEDSYIAEVCGESMVDAGIFPGDKAVIDTTRSPRDRDIVLAMVDGMLTLKYYALDKENNTWLVPASEKFRPIMLNVDGEANRCIGVMVSLVKKCPSFDNVMAKRLDNAYEQYKSIKVTSDVQSLFYKYISNEKDKELVLERMHQVLDGKEGIEVVKILYACKACKYIERFPSEGALNAEFDVKISHSQYYRDKNKSFYEEEIEDYLEALT